MPYWTVKTLIEGKNDLFINTFYDTEQVYSEIHRMVLDGTVDTFLCIMNHSILIDFESYLVN